MATSGGHFSRLELRVLWEGTGDIQDDKYLNW
jgi:hypothetical protein